MIEVEVFNSSSNGNCYRLISGSSQLLIEAGIKLSDIRKKTGHQLGRLDGVLVSHEHGDHAKSVMQLIDNGVVVYMSEGTKAALGAAAKYAEIVRPDMIKTSANGEFSLLGRNMMQRSRWDLLLRMAKIGCFLRQTLSFCRINF